MDVTVLGTLPVSAVGHRLYVYRSVLDDHHRLLLDRPVARAAALVLSLKFKSPAPPPFTHTYHIYTRTNVGSTRKCQRLVLYCTVL